MFSQPRQISPVNGITPDKRTNKAFERLFVFGPECGIWVPDRFFLCIYLFLLEYVWPEVSISQQVVLPYWIWMLFSPCSMLVSQLPTTKGEALGVILTHLVLLELGGTIQIVNLSSS